MFTELGEDYESYKVLFETVPVRGPHKRLN